MALFKRLFAHVRPVAVVAGLLACVFYSHFFVYKAHLEVDIETESHLRTVLRVYWAEGQEDFSQNRSAERRVKQGRELHSIFLGNLGTTDRLRIDPIEYAGKVIIRGLRISQPGFKPIELSAKQLQDRLKPVQQIDNINLLSDGIAFEVTGPDAQFELLLSPFGSADYLGRWLTVMAAIMLLVVTAGTVLSRFGREHGWVVIALCVAFVMIVTMASISRFNTHPDEFVHWQAVKFYSQNFLPPRLDSPDIAGTFSWYGFSRLANFEVFYQFAGYSVALLQDLKIPLYLKSRLFNCLLFLVMLIMAARSRDFRIVAIPLLLSAQTWYLFSYTNSDAFGIFIGMMVAFQAVSRDSTLNRLLSAQQLQYKWPAIICIGLLCGLLLVVKTNFYFFALLVGLYLLWRMASGDFANRRLFWTRAAMIGMVALVPYGTRLAMDMHANGFSSAERSAIRLAVNEKYARDEFKPSTPVAEKHIYLNLKDKGASVKRMLHRELWHQKTLRTAFGVFGYTQYFASVNYYSAVSTLAVLLIGVILFSILLRAPPATHVLFAVTASISIALVVALFVYSWTVSFQPQGRYLVSVLPMLGILLFEVRKYLFPKLFEGLVMLMFLMATYSFLFVGLARIEKVNTVSNVFI